MGYSDSYDDGKGKEEIKSILRFEEEREETFWTDEMSYGLGAAGCWCPIKVATTSRIMLIKGSDRKLVEISRHGSDEASLN